MGFGIRRESSARRAAEEIGKRIVDGEIKDFLDLWKAKIRASEKYGIKGVLRNSEILGAIPSNKRDERVLTLLKVRPMRTISGVNVIAVATVGLCPWKCIYCPQGKNAPKSYTGREPAVLRAIQNDYDPYKQVLSRIRQLQEIGHEVSKCELIIIGGTFNAMERSYREWFIKRCLDAMNGFESNNLKKAQLANEKAEFRMIGLTVETRPDLAGEKEICELLDEGLTRIELGVQTLSDEVYKKINRRHKVEDVVNATKVCKDSFLKVLYHMMPGLFSDKKEDVKTFKKLFREEEFRPDMLKIYPALVMKDTKLYDMWKRGDYKPYNSNEAAEVIAEATKFIPEYVRVMRVQRDFPSTLVVDGVKKSNLRQLVDDKLKIKKVRCNCIRCREIGYKILKEGIEPDWDSIKLKRLEYAASGGKEIFLSFDETRHNALIGFLRLRKPSAELLRKEIDEKSSGVRELHVYGRMLPVGERGETGFQHKGFGRMLLEEAEKIAKEELDSRKILILSGVGVRDYYFSMDYRRDGPYVSKKLN